MQGHELVEQFAAIVLVGAGILFLAASWLARRRIPVPVSETSPVPASRDSVAIGLVLAIAALSVGAAAIHFAVIPEHAAEYLPFGIAFAVAGVLQLGFAVLAMTRRLDPFVIAVVGVNGALVGVWLMSRTIGLPVGPEPWQPEPVGLADVVATAFEGATIVAVLSAAPLTRRSRTHGWMAEAASLLSVPLVGLVLVTGLLVAAGAVSGDGDHGMRDHGAPAHGAVSRHRAM